MGRARQIMRVIGPFRLPCSILIGLVTTVLVAWWCASQPTRLIPFPYGWTFLDESTGYRPLIRSQDDRSRYWSLDRGKGRAWLQVYNRPSTELHDELAQSLSTTPATPLPSWSIAGGRLESNRITTEQLAGWPFWCVRSIGYQPIDATRTVFSLDSTFDMPVWLDNILEPEFSELPIGVLPGRFLLNTLCFAALTYALISLPARATALRRHLTNRCPACGYSLAGLASDTCPECGRQLHHPRPEPKA